mmetsp:Transcript_32915/g.57570  ORF Transcript_32915/g.57570 Transcript_32915/m.57570 type:complete len:1245 (+) Transcript_32915:3258-6992(+)
MGMSEAKEVLLLTSGLLSIPSQSQAFLDGSGLQHLMLLLTHPDSTSVLQQAVLTTFHSLLGHPALAKRFFEADCTKGLEPKLVWSHFGLKKKAKEPTKKTKTDDDSAKTAYQVLVSQLIQGKQSAKVLHGLKVLANKCSFFLQLEALSGNIADLPQLDSVKRQLKLHLLQSSSRSLNTIKHEIQTSLLQLSSDDFYEAIRLTSHPLLSNSIAAWLHHTNFLNTLYLYLESAEELPAAEYRSVFVSVADCIVTILKSRGGQAFFAHHDRDMLRIADLLDKIQVQASSEPSELSLLEEENLLTIVQADRLNSYIGQLSRIIRLSLKLENILNDLPSLYIFAGADDELARQIVYLNFRLHPQNIVRLFSEASLKTSDNSVKAFYLFEILQICFIEDRSAELLYAVAQPLSDLLARCLAEPTDEVIELKHTAQILLQWIQPVLAISQAQSLFVPLREQILKHAGVTISDLNTNFIVPIVPNAPKVSLTALGLLDEPNSPIISLLPSLRLLNSVLALHKWLSIEIVKSDLMKAIYGLVSQTSAVLTALYLQTSHEVVFSTPNKAKRKEEYLELLIPMLDLLAQIQQQLIATELPCLFAPKLLEAILDLSALCDLIIKQGYVQRAKRIQRLLITVTTLWAQQPAFPDLFMLKILDQALLLPYQQVASLQILATVFEHYVSYKDPRLHNCVSILSHSPPPAAFPLELMFYNWNSEPDLLFEFYEIFRQPLEKVKEKKSKRAAARLAYEAWREFSHWSEDEASILQQMVKIFGQSNNYEVQTGLLRILRCVLSSNQPEAVSQVVDSVMAIKGGKGLQLMLGIADVPSAKNVLIYHDAPELVMSALERLDTAETALKLLRVFFDNKIGLCGDETAKYKLVEDLPTVSQTQRFLLEARRFLTFALPAGSVQANTLDEDDPLYEEFATQPVQDEGSWLCTALVLEILLELSQHSLGRSLVLCGQYPYREDSAALLDFSDTLRYLQLAFNNSQDWSWTAQLCGLVDLLAAVLKNTGPKLAPSNKLQALVETLKGVPGTDQLVSALTADFGAVDLTPVELPHPRELGARFAKTAIDFRHIKEFRKKVRKAQSEHLVIGERFGERVQVKPQHTLTDLLPPPYPALFKFKNSLSEADWRVFLVDNVEFQDILVSRKRAEAEDSERRHHISSAPPKPEEVKPPITPYLYQQPQPTYPMHQPMFASQMSMLSDIEVLALQELKQLLLFKDKSQDPRLQIRIEQILSEHPNLVNLLKDKADF